MQANRLDVPGIVAIGRNEGSRLMHCLESLAGCNATIVYVDSGSTDGSPDLARSYGAHVVELDGSLPFTAARARNAGFEHLMQVEPRTEFVQFLDGDCMLDQDWLGFGARVLRENPAVAVVCGRRREVEPEASIYNRLCDLEWNTPVGFASACGGDALMRADAVRLVGGYDPTMIAGEEPELCLRLARRGFQVARLDAEMSVHDAAMTRWTQWWMRAVRTGHTTAELLDKHGNAPEHRRLRRGSSALAWAVGVPLASLLLLVWAASSHGLTGFALACLAPAAVYLFQFERIRRRSLRAGRTALEARAYATSCLLAKWPEVAGMTLYTVRRALRRQARWIEYKDGPRGRRGEGLASRQAAAQVEWSEAN